QRRVHVQPHLARAVGAPAAGPLPRLLDGADAGIADGRRVAGAVGMDLRAAGVQYRPGAVAVQRVAAIHAVPDRAWRDHRDLPGGTASQRGLAACFRRCVDRRDPAGTDQVGPGRVLLELRHLPEALWRAGGPADPAAVDLPVLGGGPAGCVVRLGGLGVPLSAGIDAPAVGIRAVWPAAAAWQVRAGAHAR